MTVTKRKAKPITAHPMFPIVTALWFAAFLSLGSFAVAPQLLEGPVVALGIPDILPAAQPPLGFTVRALLALVMLGVGGFAGYFIGKALAGKSEAPVRARSFVRKDAGRAQDAAPKSDSPATPRATHRRPLNPLEDLGEPLSAPFSGEPYAPVDPRALDGMDEADARDAQEFARLPWEQEELETTRQVFATDAQPSEAAPAYVRHSHAQVDDPLALDLLFADAEVLSRGIEPEYVEPTHTESAYSEPAFSEPAFNELEPAEARIDAPVFEAQAPIADHAAEPEVAAPARPAAVPLIKAPLLQAPATSPTPLSRSPLEDLGLVQLTERLALAIGRRQAQAEAPHTAVHHAFSPVEPAAQPAVFEPVPSAAPVVPVQPVLAQSQPTQPPPTPAEEESPLGGFTVVQPQPSAVIARFGAPEPAEAPAPVAPALAAAPAPLDESPADLAPQYERVVQLRPTALRPFAPEPEPEATEEEEQEFDRFLRVRDTKPSAKTPALPFPAADFDTGVMNDEDPAADELCAEDQADEDDDDGDEAWAASGAEDDVAEARYPSLLDMGAGSLRHKALFSVPTDEDEDIDDGFEPAVVFPGQTAARTVSQNSGHPGQPAAPFETSARLFERPAGAIGLPDLIIPVPGSPLAAPGKAAPSSPIDVLADPAEMQAMQQDFPPAPAVDAEEADRALRAALATLQRMTAQG
ncbi:MAG: hypothetical protein NTX28_17325 [Novosphingobium sp.]|nr:hypothetical protein [Novosphingobium sp.]